ncbi:hypothetical protein EDC01DRAFT_674053 [Geopyxis carbonaria]|nr:hypothetical protein EDC01DRAFT_674053 [Geopyxis carbonaria]
MFLSKLRYPIASSLKQCRFSTSAVSRNVGRPDIVPSTVGSVGLKTGAPSNSDMLQKYMLKDKVVVITGGARGLGFNMAEALCDVGCKGIAILDVMKENGDIAVETLRKKFNVPASFYKVDVTNEHMIEETMDKVSNDFGGVDVLVCSAGIADSNIPAETYNMDMFRRLININLTGTFICAQAAGKRMIESGKGGSIIFVASMSGHIVNSPQEQSCYNASKAGVIMLGKSLAAEWATKGVRVNSISPGYMDTALNRVPALEAQKVIWKEKTPMGRLGAENDLNGLAVYLASDASAFMTGSDIVIDGGYTVW